ncbi:MAG: hypothetical protein K2N48_10770 [Muribaculaceae bacterium]|nr:hypothetical protein [Muribaculaceae bacterium]
MRQLSLLILLITAITVRCQQPSGYEIFKTLGRITNATSGKEVRKGDAVKATDRLTIDKDAKVGILDRQHHRIFYSQKPGTHRVASIIRDAKRKADNAVAAVNSEVFNQTKQAGKQPHVNGVSYRGPETENAYLQSVCNAILDIASAMPDTCLTLKAVEDDNSFHFSMTNGTDSLLYVNVIAVRAEGTPKLCLNVGMTDNEPYICIAPNSQLTLSEFEFANSESTDFYMFASFEPVDSQALSLMLNLGNRSEEVENATILVSPKITVQPHE